MPDADLAPRTSLKRSSSTVVGIAIAIVVAGAVAGGVWFWRWRGEPASVPAPAAAPAPDATAATDATSAAPETPAAPVSPADARALLEPASAAATYRRWLAEGDLIERWAAVTENLASGASPSTHLAFLRPAASFSVLERDGRKVISPASYQRYDGFADAIATLDAHALVRAFRALHPAIEGAFRALGYPQGALDRATEKALRRIVAAPVVDGDVGLVDEGGVYLFEDAALEQRGEVDKHLLRMGPRNARLVQAKARELLAALGLRAAPTAGGR